MRYPSALPAAVPPTPPAAAPACEQWLNMLSRAGVLVGDFYLCLGRAYEAAALPEQFERGEMKQCYKNAGQLALACPALAYVEGYATSALGFATHHAWCVTEQGFVVDPTWGYSPANEYWGLALSTDFLEDHLARTMTWGVLGDMIPRDLATAPPCEFMHPLWLPPADRVGVFQALVSQRMS